MNIPTWLLAEVDKLRGQFPDINYTDAVPLEQSDIELFVIHVHNDFKEYIIILRNNTNYDTWIDVKIVEM